ncbi:hypothetical protein HanHA300_Chr15g0572901 [Helianthus annuus]|nr:hypothetical protein HanHA300_Chr15g0572901 [Helianthus annuus]KAJ0473790.1 hypothetical protein HanHA89_Chr15g0622381 [Helianthus annuus]KAJ0649366.1 hypothetical protein HanLR1_Chr15g0583471 [Helianthus annuus]KAJ0653168.1 hypothetical protein HanOQP8_Chr15g0580501 [Helianthus annuus]
MFLSRDLSPVFSGGFRGLVGWAQAHHTPRRTVLYIVLHREPFIEDDPAIDQRTLKIHCVICVFFFRHIHFSVLGWINNNGERGRRKRR